jgi:NADH-quinone oxidoreductase subunit J
VDTLSNFDFYSLILVIVLGASGIFLLLPHGHGLSRPRLAHQVGLGLSAAAVLAFLGLLRVRDVELISKVFFYAFAFASVAGGILTVTSRDPVHSALWFAAVVLATSGLFLLSGAQFLAAGTVIVYAGAIIVTFLFVIMLAQKEGRAIYDRMSRAPFLATLASFLMFFGLAFPLIGMKPGEPKPGETPTVVELYRNRVKSAKARMERPEEMTLQQRIIMDRVMNSRSMLPEMTPGEVKPPHVASLGTALFTDHLLVVELAGSLLFVALIGALAIASPKPPIRPATLQAPAQPDTAPLMESARS